MKEKKVSILSPFIVSVLCRNPTGEYLTLLDRQYQFYEGPLNPAEADVKCGKDNARLAVARSRNDLRAMEMIGETKRRTLENVVQILLISSS